VNAYPIVPQQVNIQATVDHNGQFIAFQSGWAGSRPDRAIWPHTWIFRERHRLFANGEFLLADGGLSVCFVNSVQGSHILFTGYSLSPYVLIPFAKNELQVDRRRRREFNRKISRARIVVEWAFGRLKWRFPALTKLGAVHDINDTYRTIEALMIVHNMCFDHGDAPEYSRARPDGGDAGIADDVDDLDYDDDTEDDRREGEGENGGLLRAGRAFRERCMDIICP
jgi:hypothetical protein